MKTIHYQNKITSHLVTILPTALFTPKSASKLGSTLHFRISIVMLLLSTHSSLFFFWGEGGPFLLFYGVLLPASPTRHLAGLLHRRNPYTNPGPTAWCVSVGN